MGDRYTFDADICRLLGPTEAILYCHFEYWIKTNLANKEHMHDGACWMYTSRKGMARFFDYLSESQIRTGIKNLVSAGVLVTGKYNTRAFDQTTWYTFGEAYRPEWYKSGMLDNFGKPEESAYDEAAQTRENPWSNFASPLVKSDQCILKEIKQGIKENQEKGKAALPPPPCQQIADLYMLKLPALAKVAKLTNRRIRDIKARWFDRMHAGKYRDTETGLAYWERFFAKVAETPFLTGDNQRGWRADFDYLMSERGFLAVIENKFQLAERDRPCRN
jgi:hypothetical protein